MKKDGITALECLQRAFEVAISYSVYKNGPSEKLLRRQYDTELLITGKKNKSLSERYSQAKQRSQKQMPKNEISVKKTAAKKEKLSSNKTKNKNQKPKNYQNKSGRISIFWLIMIIAFTISLTTIGFLLLTTIKP